MGSGEEVGEEDINTPTRPILGRQTNESEWEAPDYFSSETYFVRWLVDENGFRHLQLSNEWELLTTKGGRCECLGERAG